MIKNYLYKLRGGGGYLTPEQGAKVIDTFSLMLTSFMTCTLARFQYFDFLLVET